MRYERVGASRSSGQPSSRRLEDGLSRVRQNNGRLEPYFMLTSILQDVGQWQAT